MAIVYQHRRKDTNLDIGVVKNGKKRYISN